MVLDKNDPNYRQCSLSVMDNIADPHITFNEKGICNYYDEYLKAEKEQVLKGKEGEQKYQEIIAQMKADGKGHKYDCILGVSGGVDSSYLALLANQAGLKVLCVHFDNGWNSELAVKNIQSIVEKCDFDLYTYVIDWEEFKDIQLAYFKANVIDIEAITDIAIFSALDII
jgi:tRNA(Ile)-lysidine synthase TilS/MesJ